jgi:condensin complex subunit 3
MNVLHRANIVNSDVRRIVLVHIPIIPQTIEAILIRSRDVSKAVRKALFSTVLAKMDPRHALLNQSRLAMVIAAGFADSEESACTATGRLISKWLGIISRESNLPISSPSGGISPEECVPLLAFIELFDIAESTGRHAAQLTVSWIINFHIGPTKMIRFEGMVILTLLLSSLT